jgi:guanylate kinase
MTKLLGNLKTGLAFVVSAPAGTGKTTLVQMLLKEFPCVAMSISCTTREIRAGEIQGHDYSFLSKEEFEHKIANRDFLEFVQLYGNYYGTDLKTIEALQKQGKHVILVIDTQGALQLKGKFPATFIFLKPPSLKVLRERLTQRRTETNEVIEERLEWARKEIELVKYYDYCIVNEELSVAYEALRSIVIAEEHRVDKSQEPRMRQ